MNKIITYGFALGVASLTWFNGMAQTAEKPAKKLSFGQRLKLEKEVEKDNLFCMADKFVHKQDSIGTAITFFEYRKNLYETNQRLTSWEKTPNGETISASFTADTRSNTLLLVQHLDGLDKKGDPTSEAYMVTKVKYDELNESGKLIFDKAKIAQQEAKNKPYHTPGFVL